MIFKFLIEFFVFVFGLCIGSFLNCVIYRTELQENMPKGSPHRKAISFLRGKSFCPHCKHMLSWLDLFPVFSFLLLGGKCRYCKKIIGSVFNCTFVKFKVYFYSFKGIFCFLPPFLVSLVENSLKNRQNPHTLLALYKHTYYFFHFI